MEAGFLWRLSSFAKYPNFFEISPSSFATNGFYYKEDTHRVTCSKCNTGLQFDNSIVTEDLLEKHRQLSPFCTVVSSTAEEYTRLGGGGSSLRTNNSATDLFHFVDNITDFRDPQITETVFQGATGAENVESNPTLRNKLDPDKLRSETVRISTFCDWPRGAKALPQTLAREGLFYTGFEDKVQCAFCNGCIDNWKISDNPSERHKTHFPDCPIVLGSEIGNIALKRDNSLGENSSRSFQSTLEPSIDLLSFQTSQYPSSAEDLDDPKYPEYSDITRRIESFADGQMAPGQTVECLAVAGFFYRGPRDRVQCFHCGGVLKEWEPSDDPIVEHRRWFEHCIFAKTLQSVGSGALGVDPREIRARLDTPMVRIILDMGYPIDLVKRVLEERLSSTGDDFQSAENLLEAIFAHEGASTSTTTSLQALTLESSSLASNSLSGAKMETGPPPELQESKPLAPGKTFEGFGEEAATHDESVEFAEENRRLREARTCKVCMEAEVSMVFLPCGHLVCCSTCSTLVSNCPICRVYIRKTVKTFLS